MDNLMKLRIGLTVAAVAGFLPISILFAVGIVAFFIPLIFVAKSAPFGTLAFRRASPNSSCPPNHQPDTES